MAPPADMRTRKSRTGFANLWGCHVKALVPIVVVIAATATESSGHFPDDLFVVATN